jgi:hypothetical protein
MSIAIALEIAQFIATAIASVAGGFSAYYWTQTARTDIEVPKIYSSGGITYLGGKHDHTEPQKEDPIGGALRKQAVWNSKAAKAAAVAAACAAVAFLVSLALKLLEVLN